ncbi:hypothetical protein [Nitrosomonas sp. Is37]|uniref:hypothetical protein n=1 Tax=Nitrosomonas sp. Is37 TaxID=3080535 RepID=UPI00294AA757|nr:hypothetical protein [Nitrosomonas sp. Is37]MDV6343267.1 hypothetical protein [Nitrosomonas sp. Is37]
MNYHDLDRFRKEIESIERFFMELAAREDEVLTFGIRRATQWESFGAIQEILPAFEAKIYEFLAFLRPINKQLLENTQELVQGTKLAESIASIQVSLRIAAERRSLGVRGELFNTFLFHLPYFSNLYRRRRLFSEEVVSIQKILVTLGRLKNLITVAGNYFIRRWSTDNDVFRPSNLDEGRIINHIEIAISELEQNIALPEDEKKQLIEYLYKAKSELAEDWPSWNKIVGALVIAAAIISGIADARQAYENIDSIIKYILGTSVEHHIPSTVPLLERSRFRRNDDGIFNDPIQLA